MTRAPAAAILLLAAVASAHRTDEYLQAALLSIGKDALEAQLTLTPGVAIFPIVAADIDTDSDGVFSDREQRAYAARVLRDLSLSIDGRPLTPYLRSVQFPDLAEMKAGGAGIRIDLHADLPAGGGRRRLVFENRHQPRIGVYLVNSLVPRDHDVRIVAQNRNESQSRYELEYTASGGPANWLSGPIVWVAVAALLFAVRFAVTRRGRNPVL